MEKEKGTVAVTEQAVALLNGSGIHGFGVPKANKRRDKHKKSRFWLMKVGQDCIGHKRMKAFFRSAWMNEQARLVPLASQLFR